MGTHGFRATVVSLAMLMLTVGAGCNGNSSRTAANSPVADGSKGFETAVAVLPSLATLGPEQEAMLEAAVRLRQLSAVPPPFTGYDAAKATLGYRLLRPAEPFASNVNNPGHIFTDPKRLAQIFQKPGGDAVGFDQAPATALPVPASALVLSPNPIRSKWVGPYYVTLWENGDTAFERFKTGAQFDGEPVVGLVTGDPKDVGLMDEFIASLSFAGA